MYPYKPPFMPPLGQGYFPPMPPIRVPSLPSHQEQVEVQVKDEPSSTRLLIYAYCKNRLNADERLHLLACFLHATPDDLARFLQVIPEGSNNNTEKTRQAAIKRVGTSSKENLNQALSMLNLTENEMLTLLCNLAVASWHFLRFIMVEIHYNRNMDNPKIQGDDVLLYDPKLIKNKPIPEEQSEEERIAALEKYQAECVLTIMHEAGLNPHLKQSLKLFQSAHQQLEAGTANTSQNTR